MAAFAFVKIEALASEEVASNRCKNIVAKPAANNKALFQGWRDVTRNYTAKATVRLVQRILLSKISFPRSIQNKIVVAVATHINSVEFRQNAHVVQVTVCYKSRLFYSRITVEKLFKQRNHLATVAGKATVYEQKLIITLQNIGVAAAGRFNRK